MLEKTNVFAPWVPVISSMIGALAVVCGIFITQWINKRNERRKQRKAIKPELIRLIHLLHYHKQQVAYACNASAFYFLNAKMVNHKLISIERIPEEAKYQVSKFEEEFQNFRRLTNETNDIYQKEIGEMGKLESELMGKVFELEQFYSMTFVQAFSTNVMTKATSKRLLNLMWDYNNIPHENLDGPRAKFTSALAARQKEIENEGTEIITYIINTLKV
jgi:hypothetical protein